MPFPQATLLNAVAATNLQVGTGGTIGLLQFYISFFTQLWPGTLDSNSENNRTVLDWRVFGRAVQAVTPLSGNAQQRQAVVNAIIRVLYAANDAFAAGRITVAQRDNVLSAWNNSVGALP